MSGAKRGSSGAASHFRFDVGFEVGCGCVSGEIDDEGMQRRAGGMMTGIMISSGVDVDLNSGLRFGATVQGGEVDLG